MLNALYALPLEQFKQRIRQKLRAFVQDIFLTCSQTCVSATTSLSSRLA